MPPTKKETSAGCVVYRIKNNKPQILLVETFFSPHIQIPKGHIEPGESRIQAAKRETYEETGIKPEIIDFLGSFEEKTSKGLKTVYVFLGKAINPDDILGGDEEIKEVSWHDIDNLKNIRAIQASTIARAVLKVKEMHKNGTA